LDLGNTDVPTGLDPRQGAPGNAAQGTYYYDDSTGFVGRVVENNGTVYVVFRGTDLGNLTTLNFDVQDWASANIPLAFGTQKTAFTFSLDKTTSRANPTISVEDTGKAAETQFDDALRLTLAAMKAAHGEKVVLVGQSLGGGLASLVSAVLNLKAYVFAPAPFAKELTDIAALAASHDNPSDNLSGGGSGSTTSGSSDTGSSSTTGSSSAAETAQVLTILQNNLKNSGTAAFRDSGEALSGGLLGSAAELAGDEFNFSQPVESFDLGVPHPTIDESVALHGPALHNLVAATYNTKQSFAVLFQNDAAIRSAFLDNMAIAAPLNSDRLDLRTSTSFIAKDGPSQFITEDALWKTLTLQDSFYKQFYTRFSSWLSAGSVAQGLDAQTDNPLSLHDAVVDLGLQVVRDSILRSEVVNPDTSQDLFSSTGLNVFTNGETDTSNPPPYVLIKLSDITATEKDLKDQKTNKAFGVLNITYDVATTLINLFPGDDSEKQSLAGSILGGALPTDLLDQVKKGDIQLKPWDTLIVQAGFETQVDPKDKSLQPQPFKVDATALDLSSAVIFGGKGPRGFQGPDENGQFDETIKGSKGNDVLVSGNADTTFLGSTGRDLIIGGANTDTYIAQASSSASDDTTFVGGTGSDTAVYGNGFDHVTFTLQPDDLVMHPPGSTPISGADIAMGGDRVDQVIDAKEIEFAGKTGPDNKITANNEIVKVDPELEPVPNGRPNPTPNDIIIDGGGRDANNTLDLNHVTASFESANHKFVFSGDQIVDNSIGTPASGITYRDFSTIIGGGGDPPNDTFILNTPEDSSIKDITLGDGNDTIEAFLQDGTDTLTMTVGKGNDELLYTMPVLTPADPNKQGFVVVNAGNGDDTIGGAGPGQINLGTGTDVVLPGFGSVVNASSDQTRGQDVIFTNNDVQLNNLLPQDRLSLLGITDLTGGLQWKGSESPFAYGTFARYGINQNGELVVQDYLTAGGQTMFVAGYHGGPGVPVSQETAGIFIAQASIGASLLLKAPAGWLTGTLDLMKDLLKESLGPDVLSKIGIDPLVFDLTGDGINLTDLSSVSPRFDMNGNGFSVQTGWIGQGNGLLVLDRNGDGQINNVSELFGGEATSGGPAAIGVAQLAKYDSNLDGVIDANDPIYSQLRIWVDSNGNGVVDPGELLTLQQAGIASINLTPTPQSGDLSAGNQIMATGSFTRGDGSAGTFADVSFQINTRDTTFTGDTSVSAAAAALPNLKGYGTLTDLQVAMTRDPALANSTLGPSLMSVVQSTLPTLTSLDLPTLRGDITPILTAWANAVQGVDSNGNPLTIATQSHADVPILVATDGTGAETVTDFAYEVTDSQGSYWKLASGTQVTDAQGNVIERPTLAQITSEPPSGSSWTTFSGAQLDFMERYTGESIPLGTGAPVNPGAALADAGQLISTMWQMLNQLAVALAGQGPLANYFQGIAYNAATNQFVPTTDQQLTPMYEAIFRAAPQDAAGATSWLDSWKPVLDVVLGDFNRPQGLDVTFGYMFDSMVTAFETVGLPLDIREAAAALGVPADQIVEGGSTLLSTSDSGNIFYMSNGDQTAIGGNGTDNYVMGGHFGHDVIIDDEGIASGQAPNILRFAGVKSTDVTASRDGNDLILDVNGTNQEVRIVNEFIGVKPSLLLANINDAWGVTQIAFADGVVWEEPDMAWAVEPNTNGVNGSLLGTSAMDVLNGGNGNHFLSGGDGGDIYLYGRGDGNDTIFVNSDNPFQTAPNIVELGPGIASSDLGFTRDGNSNDLLITVNGDSSDSLLIQGQFTATFTGPFGTQFFDRIQALSFSDGTSKTFEDIENTLIANAEATPGMALYGFDGVDDTLDPGLGGNRFLSGGNNNDTYVFGLGYGNDTIKGGHGNILSGQNQTVLFNPDLDPSQVRVIRNGDSPDATLILSDGSTLLLQNQFDAIFTGSFGTQWLDRVQNFQFQDAAQTVWTANDLMNKALAYEEANGGHTIFGFGGFDQTIDPGPGGNFFLSGGNNNDTYVFGLGYGNDTIKGGHDNILSGGNQTVLFGAGVDPSQVQVIRNADSGDVTLVLSDGSSLTIENQFVNAGSLNIWPDRINNFQFQDVAQTVWTVDDIMNKAIAQQEAVPGGAIYGFQRGDTIDPGLGGNRFMSGEGGPDVYVFGQGYGHDTIFDNSGLFASNAVQVLFNSDVDPSTVRFERNGASNDLEIFLADGSELDIQGQFDPTRTIGPHFLDRIWTFQFQDAAQTSFSYLDIEHKLIAQEEAAAGGTVYDFAFGNGLFAGGGNTLDGFAGNETLVGAQASFTTFVFGLGYGHEVVDGGQDTDPFLANFDELSFGAGITESQITFARQGGDVTLGIAGTSDTVTIKNEFGGASANAGPNPVMQFNFADGTSWDFATFEQNLLAGEEATAGSEVIGYGGNEVLQSGAPNQTLIGSDGTVTLIGSGSGTLIGGSGTDTLIGGTGDLLIGGSGADTLIGGAGSTLIGGGGTDTLIGGAGGLMIGGGGTDLLYGAAGDTLIGNSASDTFFMGAGAETLIEQHATAGGNDTLAFAPGVTEGALELASDGTNVTIGVSGTPDTLVIRNEFGSSGQLSGNAVLNFAFADGTTLNATQFEQLLIADQASVPGATILGTAGSDTLNGAGGNDYLQGNGGSDTYVFGRGYGHEVINNLHSDNGQSVLLFDADTAPTDLQVIQSGNDLILAITGTGDQVTVQNYFAPSKSGVSSQLAAIDFANGTSWTPATVQSLVSVVLGSPTGGQTLQSANNNVTFDGGASNDVLIGTGANDTYLFGPGDGQEVVRPNGSGNQVLQFKAGIAPSDVTITADAQGDFTFGISGTTDAVTVTAPSTQFAPNLTAVQFADGTSWDLPTMEIKELQGAPGDAAKIDYTGNNTLDLGQGTGERLLVGNGANDTFVFGRGYGQETVQDPGVGNSVLLFNADTTPSDVSVSADTNGDLILSILGTTDQVTIANYLSTYNNSGGTPVSAIRFADGTSWSYETAVALELTPTPGKDVLVGDAKRRVLDGAGISHILFDNGGNDTFVMGRGDGQVVMDDSTRNSTATLLFDPEVAPADVSIRANLNGELIFSIAGTSDTATVVAPSNLVGVQFADGTSWSLAAAQAVELSDGVAGGVLYDFTGGSTLDGHAGNNTLIGAGGNDTYIFGRGYGSEIIFDAGQSNSVLRLNADTAPADVVVSEDGTGDLILSIAGTNDRATVSNYFATSGAMLAAIDFADGTSWNYQAVLAEELTPAAGKDTLFGDGGDNTLNGAGISHTLIGNGGNDTFVFGRGYGPNIVDNGADSGSTLVFNADTSPADVVFGKDAKGDYVFTIAGTNDQVTVLAPGKLAAVKFADGTTWTAASFQAPVNPPTLSVQAASGNAAAAIPLSIAAALGDNNSAETLSVTIAGLPSGASLSAGTRNSDGSWTLTPAELSGLTLATPLSTEGSFSLSVTAIESDPAGALTTSAMLALAVAAVASPPTLSVQNITGFSTLAVPLGIAGGSSDPDGGESVSVTIAGLPAGVTLSAGTLNADGSWTLTAAQLTGLSLTAPVTVSGTFTLTVTAVSTEVSDGSQASTSATLSLTIDPPVETTAQDGAVLQVEAGDFTLIGTGARDTLIAGSGTDTLIGSGSGDVLVSGSGLDSLVAAGSGDTLVGAADGDTLISTGSQTVAFYSMDNATVDLAMGQAMVNGSSTFDVLFAINNVAVSGSSDTVIAGNGPATLTSSGSSNTLIAGSGADVLSSNGTGDVLIAGSGADTLSSSGSGNTLMGGSGAGTLTSSGTGDVLVGGSSVDTLSSSGTGNTLIAGSAADTLSSSGHGDTLVGNAAGSTLDGTGGSGVIAAYTAAQVVVDLTAGTAAVNGSGTADTLIGITAAAAFGQSDTLIGVGATDTLVSNVAGNTLINGIAAYLLDNVMVALGVGTASINGSSTADTLIGIDAVVVSGSSDTAIAGSGAQTLSASGSFDTLIAGSGSDLLLSSGSGDTVVAGSGIDTLSSSGSFNTLIAGSGADTLLSTGTGDTLVGDGGGSTLDAAAGTGVIAAYGLDKLAVDLTAGTAAVNGSTVSDTLLGIGVASVSGQADTLIGGSGASTLISNAGGNTLISGTGLATAIYGADTATIDLAAGFASVNGAAVADSLIGITAATVSGANDTLLAGSGSDLLSSSGGSDTVIAGSGADTLSSNGTADTLIAGGGADTLLSSGLANSLIAGSGASTLISSGGDDTLFGNGGGSTLIASGATGAVAAYTVANVAVDLTAGTASVAGTTTADTLIGITTVAADGSNETLIGNGAADTLISDAAGNTLIGGYAAYALEGVAVDLGAGTASVAGTSASDTLIGIAAATVEGSGDTLLGGTGGEALFASGSSDTLIGGTGADALVSTGSGNTLIAGGAADILTSTGSGDTLIGNALGSILDGSTGSGVLVAYALDNVAVDLGAGTAGVTGSKDTLVGITAVEAFGHNETLIAASSTDTLIGAVAGDTLIGGYAAYLSDGVTVDLGAGTASIAGGSSDTLIGITAATVGGSNDTLIAGSGAETLISIGTSNTLVAGSGADQLLATSGGNVLIAGGGADTLAVSGGGNTLIAGTGTDLLAASGSANTLLGGSGDTLISTGAANTLVAGSGVETLVTGGSGDTLIGNADGSTLDASAGSGAIAAYSIDNLAVDLSAGKAEVTGSSTSDTLLGIAIAAAYGRNDTLLGAGNVDTLIGDAAGGTLTGGYAAYLLDNVTVNLAAGTAAVNGTSASDTLLGITAATVAGNSDTLLAGSGVETMFASGGGDTLIAGAGADTLVSAGSSNTLIAGSGVDTLSSSGNGDTLFGNAAGSTLDGTAGSAVVAAYSLNDVTVNLAAGTAAVNGASVGDTLFGIGTVAAFGQGNTLIGSSAATTLISDAAGNTLIAGTGSATADYALDNLTVDLGAERASVNGASTGDTLVGITAVLASGNDDTLLAGSGADMLSASGTGDTLIAGSGADTLSSSGTGDTLVGNAAGSTLDGSNGSGTVAAYSFDNATVNLATGSAGVNGATASDTLAGISAVTVSGSSDTLIADGSGDTLSATGSNDTLIGDNNGDTLSAIGSNDTVLGGTGDDTFFVNGGSDTFVSGGGRDDFVVLSAATNGSLDQPQNLIDGFDPNNDTIDLTHLGALTSFADLGFSTVTFGALSYLQVGLGTNQALTFSGVTSDQLSAGNFLFHPVTAPTLSTQAASGEAATAIPLAISSALVDAGTNESLSVTVAGLPTGATLSAGTQNSDGSWTLTAAQLAGLTLTTPFTTFGDFSLAVTATATALDGTTQASTSGSIGLSVEGRPQPPVLAVQNAEGNAGSPIPLVIDTSLLDHDRPETLSLTITGLPAGTTLSAGTQNPDGSWTLTPAQLPGLTLTVPAGTTGGFEPVVTSTATLTSDGLEAQSSANFALLLNQVQSTSGIGVVLQGGSGNDTLIASGSSDTLIAGSGTETLLSSGTGNLLLAGTGFDTLATSGSHDTLTGSTGKALLSSSGSGNTLIAGSGTGTLTTSGSGDLLQGGSGSDTLIAAGNADTLLAGTGAETLVATDTGDTLIGGSGPDTLIASGSNDTLWDGNGSAIGNTLIATGADDVLSAALLPGTIDTLVGAGDHDTLFVGAGTSVLIAQGSDETLIGTPVAGAAGNDTMVGNGAGNTLIAGAVPEELLYTAANVAVDLSAGVARVNGASAADTLLGGFTVAQAGGTDGTLIGNAGADTLLSSGTGNTLLAGSAADTLASGGSGDTLVGNAAGSTLISTGTQNVAFYGLDNLTVSAATGTAAVSGASTQDTLIGFIEAMVAGSHDTVIADGGGDTLVAAGSGDTLIGGAGASTLASNAGGNTLVNGSGHAIAFYGASGVAVNLATGAAAVNGAAASDTLIGITNAVGAGNADTLIADGGVDRLTAAGSGDTLIAGSGTTTLISNAAGNTLEAGSGLTVAFYAGAGVTVDLATASAAVNGAAAGDTLIGIGDVVVAGSADTAIAGAGTDTLTAKGTGDTLLGGSGTATLVAGASGDTLRGGSGIATLVGNAGGNTLEAGAGQTTAFYSGANLAIDLGAGTATRNGATPGDTLVGIASVIARGSSDTLIAGTGDTLSVSGSDDTLIAASGGDDVLQATSGGDNTLMATVGGNTLIGVAGQTTASYAQSGIVVNLPAGQVSANGASDTLTGITHVTVIGSGDTLIADGGTDVLSAVGSGDTLLGGSGTATLASNAGGNTLIAGTGRAVAFYGGDGVTANLATGAAAVNGAPASDTLIGITNVIAAGSADTLIADAGSDTLTAAGSGDTLIGGSGSATLVGNAAGNTLEAGSGATEAYYGVAGATIDLAAGLAAVNGSSVSDMLVNIADVAVSTSSDTVIGGAGTDILTAKGKSDTLIAGSGMDTLIATNSSDLLEAGAGTTTLAGSANGDTLVAGSGAATAFYSGGNLVVDLGAGTAARTGTAPGDTLIGIGAVQVSGSNDTLVAASTGHDLLQVVSGGSDTLVSSVGGNTLIGGAGAVVADYLGSGIAVNLTAGTAGNGTSAADTLTGISRAMASGSNDTLIADGGNDTLWASGSSDTLVGGSGTATLASNAGGNTLLAGTGRTVAFYGGNGVAVNLATGTAAVNGAATDDTLIGIANVVAAGSADTVIGDGGTDTLTAGGSGDTLIGGSGTATLVSNAAGNTLEAGPGSTQVYYGVANAAIDLAAGTASVNGSSASDMLVGITNVAVSTGNDTLIAGAGSDVLTGKGDGDTLIAGGGADTLIATGDSDLLEGGSGTTTLDSNIGGNTLVSGTGRSIAFYAGSNLTIDLGAGTAVGSGTSPGDTLVGIADLSVSGGSDVLIAGGALEALTASGSGDTLIASSAGGDLLQVLSGGSDTLVASVGGNTLIGGSGSSLADYIGSGIVVNLAAGTAGNGSATDSLSGIRRVTVAGSNDTVIADGGTDTLAASGSSDTLIGGSGTATLMGGVGGDTLEAGTGKAIADYVAAGVTMNLASGTATLNGASDTLIGITNAVASGSGATLVAGSGTDTLTASGGGSTLVAGAGTDRLVDTGTGGAYDFARGDGTTTIANGAAGNSGSSNELDFGANISDEQLWFLQSGNNLQIDIMGTKSHVTVAGWFSSPGNQLQEITTADGMKLDSQVSQLVQAMATYAANNTGFNPTAATQAPNDPTLQNAITASWHH
jgi:Ca2+-binding RTX toxin-like protein